VAQYNSTEPPAAPRNLFDVVLKSLRLEGFSVRDYQHLRSKLEELLGTHIQSGRIVVDQTVVEGFDHIVDAFLGMLRGENMGKMIVQVSEL
jgi:NADPH-dependent curcumin reductase CurA